jgi:hypothetical protein
MTTVEKPKENEDKSSFEQIDITEGYLDAIKNIENTTDYVLTPNVKEKIYPEGVQKITYSPQTESIYYHKSENILNSLYSKSWELFEDRGALIENKLIEELREIKEIGDDLEAIASEEKQIDEMRNGELLESIINFIKVDGAKAYRFRIDRGEKEKCKIFSFQRANMKEEIVLFTSDRQLFLNREDDSGNVLQKTLKYMNRTVLCWYFEGLLRLKRLEKKQQRYLAKISRYQK